MDRRYDPRSIVTPYAFAVHPDLLGLPLATPWQRLGAILLDLVIGWVISLFIGFGFLALASAALLLWLAFRKPGQDVLGKLFRVFVGCLGVLVLLTGLGIFLAVRYGSEGEPGAQPGGEPVGGAGVDSTRQPGALTLLRAGQGALAFRRAESREEAQTIANGLVRTGREMNLSPSEIRETLTGLIPDDAPWAGDSAGIVDEALSGLLASDTAVEAVETPPPPAEPLSEAALDSITALNTALRASEAERADAESALQDARQELEEAQNGGLLGWLSNLVDDLGLGFGWWALYITITHAWWNGTSVGKKVFGIRVVMIDKRPLNWWLSFERAGGYAAGFATGLLGFAQVFWDPNRQGIHDKVSETIVIQDGKAPIPGPWIEEGKAQWNRGRSGTRRPESA